MLALGMVASFLTSNLTVGFILGALFNAPLVFLMYADRVIPDRSLAQGRFLVELRRAVCRFWPRGVSASGHLVFRAAGCVRCLSSASS